MIESAHPEQRKKNRDTGHEPMGNRKDALTKAYNEANPKEQLPPEYTLDEAIAQSNELWKKRADELKEEAGEDPLTGLLNRRGFLPFVENAVQRSERQAKPVSIIYLDIDNFKLINDTYGHGVGDRVLKELGSLLQEHVRGEDKVWRLGGEEFCVLLEEADRQSANKWAETLLEIIRSLTVDTRNGALSITVSIGVASRSSGDNSDATTLIDRADLAMNQAKWAGKNRAVLWTAPPNESQPGYQFKLDLGV